ncbi:MAG: hypothetical protein HY910_16180 [Desulfarculus sp.]|nr:hypothetical protein [Desulfarculus sp.]
MKTLAAALCLLAGLALAGPAQALTPERGRGISMHMLPMRVAELGGRKWGLMVAHAPYLQREKAQPVLQSTAEFLAYVRRQEPQVQGHGVWIVVTHPDAYSPPEKQLLEDIALLCRRERIPLFVARGSQLPQGWRRLDQAPAQQPGPPTIH